MALKADCILTSLEWTQTHQHLDPPRDHREVTVMAVVLSRV